MRSFEQAPVSPARRTVPRAPRWAWALLAAATLSACDSTAQGPPCGRDTDCEAGLICQPPGPSGHCAAPSAATRPALDERSIPAGPAWMGCDSAEDPYCEAAEAPGHTVDTPAYRVDRTEVTVRAYADFLNTVEAPDAGPGCEDGAQRCVRELVAPKPVEAVAGRWQPVQGMADRPMTHVTWYGARDFCAWRGQTLCTEAQWEKAARGGCGGACAGPTRRFPWGDEAPSCERAQMDEGAGPGCGEDAPAAVGSKPAGATPDGVLDMAGNVWEWVLDSWHEGYTGAPTDGSAWVDEGAKLRVYRGGGSRSDERYLRAAARGNGGAKDANEYRGFRCCRW